MKTILKKILYSLKHSSFSPAINVMIAGWAFSVGAFGSVISYASAGHASAPSWHRILKAHCITNGRSTDLLNLVTRLIRPPRRQKAVTGLLGHFTVEQQNDIVAMLQNDGFYVFPQTMPSELCDQIECFAAKANTVIEGNWDLHAPLIRYDPSRPVSRTYKIREQDAVGSKAIQRLLADPLFIAVSEAYLGTLPIIAGINVWWSALYGNEPGSDAAQLFHFDFDAPPAWLKLFVYITDVGPEGGPHVYVRGSHKPGLAQAREFRARGYERVEDEEIVSAFGADSLVEITGKRGTVFMADTRGFHKGKMPHERDRLIAQLIYCSPFFHDRGVGPALPLQPDVSLVATMRDAPRVFDRFQKPTPHRTP